MPRIWNPDVVNNARDFIRRDLLPDRMFHQVTQASRFFDARSRWSTKVKLELTTINGGKEVPSQKRDKHGQRHDGEGEAPPLEKRGDGSGNPPISAGNAREDARRLLQIEFAGEPEDCGWIQAVDQLPARVRAEGISPSWEPMFAKADTRRASRIRLTRREVQTDTALLPSERTWERKRCR